MGYAASYSTYYDIFLFLGYAALLASGSLLQTFLHCVDEISNSSKEVLVSITGSAFVSVKAVGTGTWEFVQCKTQTVHCR